MENSTHHKTLGITTFAECGPDATPLLRVNPGIDVRHALEHSANLQHIASQLMADSVMGDGGQHVPWTAVYLNEMAQAIVEDLALVRQE